MAIVTSLIWVAMGVGFLAYGFATGNHPSLGVIPAWPICFGMALLRLSLWYVNRLGKEDSEAKRIAEEARRRVARDRDRTRAYDPTFDFNKPDEPRQPN